MTTVRRHKQQRWFKPVRGSYLPAHAVGWLLYIPYIAYVIVVPIYAWQHLHDIMMAAFIALPNWVAVVAIMHYIARQASR